jgi:hypothetical protein
MHLEGADGVFRGAIFLLRVSGTLTYFGQPRRIIWSWATLFFLLLDHDSQHGLTWFTLS